MIYSSQTIPVLKLLLYLLCCSYCIWSTLCYMLSGYCLVPHSCPFLQYYSIFHSVFIMCLGYAWLSSLSKNNRIMLWIISVGTNFIETTISMSGVFFQYHYICYTHFIIMLLFINTFPYVRKQLMQIPIQIFTN